MSAPPEGARREAAPAIAPGQTTAQDTGNPWFGAGPELAVAAAAAAATALAALAVAGWPGLATVATAAAVLALVVVRGIAPRPAAQSVRAAKGKQAAQSISGYGQRRFIVATASSQAFYESDLRPVLQHLLAARLAEHHGISLYTDPAAARQAFCRTRADQALWRWIDPARDVPPAERDNLSRGIPRRTLARLVDRLERL